jgi:hypothetical protein
MVMKKQNVFKFIFALVVMSTLCLPVIAAADFNVASGKTVTLNGSMNGTADTLTDGVFLPRSTQWQTGTVWWNGDTQYAEINLGGTFVINSFIVQADDNDAYRIEYRDISTNLWNTAWNVPNYDAFGWGMQTRPNPDDDSVRYSLGATITTDMLRFYADQAYGGGDNSYSVSEIQAYGTSAVPLPSAMLLFAPGLLGLAGLKRKYLRK